LKKIKNFIVISIGISFWDPVLGAWFIMTPGLVHIYVATVIIIVVIGKDARCLAGFHDWEMKIDEDAIERLSCRRNCGTNVVCHREKLPLTFKLQKFVKKTLKGRIK